MSLPRSEAALFALWFLLVLLLQGSTVRQPPVWDTTMGLFPAAIVLSENGFDLPDLLARPTWTQGGPNLHSMSALTWLTALAIRVLGDGELLLPVLHLVHFAIAAFGLLGLMRLGESLLGQKLSLLVVATTLLFPLFLTQIGYLYFDLPLAVCTIRAVLSWSRGRWVRAAVWTALACFVKESGLVVAAALAAAAALENRPARQRAARIVGLAAFPVIFVLLQVAFVFPVEESTGFRPPAYPVQLLDTGWKLILVPDLAVLLIATLVLGVLRLPRIWAALRETPADPEADDAALDVASRAREASFLVVFAFVGFYLVFPITGIELYVLPRYYVQVVPFVLLLLADLVRRTAGASATAVALVILSAFFALNRRGEFLDFYPPVPGNEFSIAERSAEYRDLLAVQRRALDAATKLPAGVPVFYGLPEHFLLNYPKMGYVEAPLPNGHCIWLEEPYRDARLESFPDSFYVLYNFVGTGGLRLQSLLAQAERDPGRTVERTATFEQGRYRTFLFRVQSDARNQSASDW